MTHRPSGFVSLLVAFIGVSVAPSWAVAAPRVPTHVACVGDSITYGYGASNQATKSYPANLQALLGGGVQVKNFGRNAATLLSAPYGDVPYEDQAEYDLASNFANLTGPGAVVDVIIMLGTNDSKSSNWAPSGKPKNDQQFLKDYRAMVEHFSALTPKPLVYLALPLATGTNPCCSIDGAVIRDEILPLIKQVAAEKNLPTIDLNTPTTGHPEYFSDGVHPTDAGYALVAQVMRDALLADRGSGGTGGTGGIGGTGGSGGTLASGGRADGGAAGGGGSSGLTIAGSAGGPSGGGGATNVAGTGAAAGSADAGSAGALPSAGAGSSAGASSVGAGGKSSLPAAPDPNGCALSGHSPAPSGWPALGLLGLGLLAARRRSARG